LFFKNEYEDEKFSRSKKDHSPTYTTVVDLLRSVSKWEILLLWSLIIFLIQRSLFSAIFMSHEVFTPQENLHPSTQGISQGLGAIPYAGSKGKEAPEGKISL
jgi:hypothetical protein